MLSSVLLVLPLSSSKKKKKKGLNFKQHSKLDFKERNGISILVQRSRERGAGKQEGAEIKLALGSTWLTHQKQEGAENVAFCKPMASANVLPGFC